MGWLLFKISRQILFRKTENLALLAFLYCYYRPPMKFREGNVFSIVILSTESRGRGERGVNWSLVVSSGGGISGPRSLLRGGMWIHTSVTWWWLPYIGSASQLYASYCSVFLFQLKSYLFQFVQQLHLVVEFAALIADPLSIYEGNSKLFTKI